MATISGTNTFDLAFDDILDEAYARVGEEFVTGRDSQTARRSLNLLLIDIQNRGIPMSMMEEVAVTVAASTSDYNLNDKYSAVLYGVLSRDSVDIRMNRISLFDFKQIPNKTTTGRPTQYTVERNRDNLTLRLWPLPENSTDIVKIWAFVRVDDVNKQDQLVNLPIQYLPAIVSGLAYYLALKKIPEKQDVISRLKAEYEENLTRVFEEERERSSFYAVPLIPRV